MVATTLKVAKIKEDYMEQELTQEGTSQEIPQEETSKVTSEVVSTEKKETSKPRTEDEWRKMQSLKDKAEATLSKVQSELQELHKAQERQRLESRQKELTDLEGDAEGQSKTRRRHQLEDDIRQLEETRQKEEGAVERKYNQAKDLAKQYNLGLDDARELLDATSPREMELMAQLKSVEKEKSQPKVQEKSGFKADSGTSDAGGDSDEAFMKSYSEGKSNDHKRAQKILQKMK
jgi:small-conductance mechanosensitive channel